MRPTGTIATPRADLGAALTELPFIPPGMIGLQVLRPIPVDKQAASFSAITRAGIGRRRHTEHAAGAAYNRDGFEFKDVSYECLEYGQEFPLSDQMRSKYRNDFDADAAAAGMAQGVIMREMEIRIAAQIFNADSSHWYSSTAALYTDVSADWDTASTDIIAHVEAAKNQVRTNCGMFPNTMVFSATVLGWMKMNTGIKAMFPGAVVINEQVLIANLPTIFGIPNILVAGASYNTANEGLTASMSDVWSDNYCWVGVCAQSDDPIEPCAGRSFLWTDETPETVMVEQYREEQTKSDIFRARQFLDEVVFDPYFGHLMLIDT